MEFNLPWNLLFCNSKETTNSCMYIVQKPPKGHVGKNKRTSK
jgi:hypothetical protein